MQLFKAHHSFLWRKWYVLPYILLAASVILAIFTVLQSDEKDRGVTLGVVDLDQTTETKMIVDSVQKGKQLADGFTLQSFDEAAAKKRLAAEQLDGYIVLKQGMTRAFYHKGELPIEVVVYDDSTLSGILIEQLTLSVYDRLMIAEKGILTYGHFYDGATDQEIITLMIDLLAISLNRDRVFQLHDVMTISTLDYYTVAAYSTVVVLLFVTLTLLMQMNTSRTLHERLSMYRGVEGKMTLARYVIAYSYTLIFSIVAFLIMDHFLASPFELYNMSYMLCDIVLLVTTFALTFYMIDLLRPSAWRFMIKIIVLCICVVAAGFVIPLPYMTALSLQHNPLAVIFQHIVQLWMNNYVGHLGYVPLFTVLVLLAVAAICTVKKVKR